MPTNRIDAAGFVAAPGWAVPGAARQGPARAPLRNAAGPARPEVAPSLPARNSAGPNRSGPAPGRVAGDAVACPDRPVRAAGHAPEAAPPGACPPCP